MSMSLIVYGLGGCGKTTNAEAIRKVYGLDEIVDGWEPGRFPTIRVGGVLYLTCTDMPNHDFAVPYELAMQSVAEGRPIRIYRPDPHEPPRD